MAGPRQLLWRVLNINLKICSADVPKKFILIGHNPQRGTRTLPNTIKKKEKERLLRNDDFNSDSNYYLTFVESRFII